MKSKDLGLPSVSSEPALSEAEGSSAVSVPRFFLTFSGRNGSRPRPKCWPASPAAASRIAMCGEVRSWKPGVGSREPGAGSQEGVWPGVVCRLPPSPAISRDRPRPACEDNAEPAEVLAELGGECGYTAVEPRGAGMPAGRGNCTSEQIPEPPEACRSEERIAQVSRFRLAPLEGKTTRPRFWCRDFRAAPRPHPAHLRPRLPRLPRLSRVNQPGGCGPARRRAAGCGHGRRTCQKWWTTADVPQSGIGTTGRRDHRKRNARNQRTGLIAQRDKNNVPGRR
jgi:hypothetical protein